MLIEILCNVFDINKFAMKDDGYNPYDTLQHRKNRLEEAMN